MEIKCEVCDGLPDRRILFRCRICGKQLCRACRHEHTCAREEKAARMKLKTAKVQERRELLCIKKESAGIASASSRKSFSSSARNAG